MQLAYHEIPAGEQVEAHGITLFACVAYNELKVAITILLMCYNIICSTQ